MPANPATTVLQKSGIFTACLFLFAKFLADRTIGMTGVTLLILRVILAGCARFRLVGFRLEKTVVSGTSQISHKSPLVPILPLNQMRHRKRRRLRRGVRQIIRVAGGR